MVDATFSAGPSMPTLVPIPDDTNDIELSDDDYQAGLQIRIHLIRIRFQHLRMNTVPVPIWIRIQSFDDQKLKKKLKKINFFKNQQLQFTYP
jgi:hypothetical protein